MAAFPLAPGSVIGIIGGGQLGRMLALAAARLGFDVAVLDPSPDACAFKVASRAIVGAYDDPEALNSLAYASQVITFEFENVPAHAVAHLVDSRFEVAPNAMSLACAQDRIVEKTSLNSWGASTTPFESVTSAHDISPALDRLGAPALLKTAREGYDGKGQTWVENHADAGAAWLRIGGKPAILEQACNFKRELSIIAARSRDGEIACYPLGENHHEGGILRRTSAPAQVSKKVESEAQTIAARILTGLDYVGVVAVELFEMAGGRLLVNEIAPRVHNSGHWTLDGCEVDQFEQHIRAVAGWPLGPTKAMAHVEMINLIGPDVETWKKYAGEHDARVWLYGKGEARPGRKMGHVNRLRPLD